MENSNNYDLYRSASEEALNKLVQALRGEEMSDKDIKLANQVLNSARALMKEHNSHTHQVRSNKVFQLAVFKEFASDEQKQALRDKVKVELDGSKIAKLLS